MRISSTWTPRAVIRKGGIKAKEQSRKIRVDRENRPMKNGGNRRAMSHSFKRMLKKESLGGGSEKPTAKRARTDRK
jgi:hypothetical protein